MGDRGEKGKAVDYKETGSDVIAPTDSPSPGTTSTGMKRVVEATAATGSLGLVSGVQNPDIPKESEGDDRMDAIDSTPIQDLATEATVAVVEPTVTPTTESARMADQNPSSAAVATEGELTPVVAPVAVEQAVTETPVQEEEVELVAVRAKDGVFEIVSRNCGDAI